LREYIAKDGMELVKRQRIINKNNETIAELQARIAELEGQLEGQHRGLRDQGTNNHEEGVGMLELEEEKEEDGKTLTPMKTPTKGSSAIRAKTSNAMGKNKTAATYECISDDDVESESQEFDDDDDSEFEVPDDESDDDYVG
jgi:hypothetical protein